MGPARLASRRHRCCCCLALLLMWHVVNGKHGLTVWHQKRAEDKQLQQEMKQLQQENARLREHVDHLKSDPDAIEHEAREKLHYAKPDEVIVALPPSLKTSPNPQPSKSWDDQESDSASLSPVL